jgi:5-formyltetrahydrofolate cyclo-ligase
VSSNKIGEDDEHGQGQFASPPCFMHELDPAYGMPVDHQQARDVARWRKSQRERLISARLALSAAERAAHSSLAARYLDQVVPFLSSAIVSAYWPFRGEPDLRPWMSAACSKGVRIALPVVVAKGQSLVFREWHSEARLEQDIYNIPYPADGVIVTPTVVIGPLVGFDPAGYWLSYGGGYFDRTLAALDPRPLAIGVGHPIGALASIYPQPHDIRMDIIVTATSVDYRSLPDEAGRGER